MYLRKSYYYRTFVVQTLINGEPDAEISSPGQGRDNMRKNEVKSLYQMAEYINEREDWPIEAEEIIRANGWKMLDGEWDICTDGERRLEFDETGDAVVREISMRKLYTDNNSILDVLYEHGINVTCNDDMEIIVSNYDASKIGDIVDRYAPWAAYDYTIE